MLDNTISGKLWNLNEDMTTKNLGFLVLRAQFPSTKQRARVVTKGQNVHIILYIFWTSKSILYPSLTFSVYRRVWPLGFHLSSINGSLWQRRIWVFIPFASCLLLCNWVLAMSSPQAITSVWAPFPRKQSSLGCCKCPFSCPFRPVFGDPSPLLLSPSCFIILSFVNTAMKSICQTVSNTPLIVSCVPVRFLTNMSSY